MFNAQSSKSKSLHTYRNHSAIQFQPFYAVISVFLHGNISHFAMLSQSYWFACAILPPPTNVACDTRDMFFGFVCMQRYKILQAIARLSQIFLCPIWPALSFKHKSGNDGGDENKNQLEEKRRRRRRFLLLFLRLSFFLFLVL